MTLMEKIWFRKSKDGLYWRPITWHGWTLGFIWAAANIWYFLKVDLVSVSANQTLLDAAPFFVLSTIILLVLVHCHTDRNWF